MNIEAYFRERESTVLKIITDLDKKLVENAAEAATLGKEIEKIETASKSAAAAGIKVDVQSTEERIKALKDKRAALLTEQESIQVAKKEACEKRDALKPLEQLVKACKSTLHLTEVPEMESVEGILSHIHAQLVFENDKPTACKLRLGRGYQPVWQFSLPIKSSVNRLRRGVLPQALQWVPEKWLPVAPHPQTRDEGSLLPLAEGELSNVYYMPKEDTFRLLTWGENAEMPEAVCDTTLLEFLDERFADGCLDLDAKNDSELLPRLREAVLAVTQPATEVVYAPTSSVKTTAEIEKAIAKPFRAFINAPWTPSISHLLANFKYYCEQGERPRFHSLPLEGAYGFRLRTRDHSWITGKLYIVPDGLPYPSESSQSQEIISEHHQECLRLGRLILRIEGEERRY